MLLVAAQNVATINKPSEDRAKPTKPTSDSMTAEHGEDSDAPTSISFLYAQHAKQQETPPKQNMLTMCYRDHSGPTLNYAPTTFNPFVSHAILERRYKSDSRGL